MVGDPHKPPLGAAASAIGLQTVLQTEEAKGTTPAFLSGHSHARQSAFEDMCPRGLGWQQGQGGLRYPRHKGQSQGVGKGLAHCSHQAAVSQGLEGERESGYCGHPCVPCF